MGVDESVSTLMKTDTTIDKQRTSMEKKSSSLSISKESELPIISEPSGLKTDVSMVSKIQKEKQQAKETQKVLTIKVEDEHSDSKEKSDQKEKSPDTPTEVSDEWALLIQESIKEAKAELISDQPENVKSQYVEAEEVGKMSLKEFERKAENEVINETKTAQKRSNKLEKNIEGVDSNEKFQPVSCSSEATLSNISSEQAELVVISTDQEREPEESEEMPKEIIKHMIDVQTTEVEKIARMKLSILQELKEKEALLKHMEEEEFNLKKSLEQLPVLHASSNKSTIISNVSSQKSPLASVDDTTSISETEVVSKKPVETQKLSSITKVHKQVPEETNTKPVDAKITEKDSSNVNFQKISKEENTTELLQSEALTLKMTKELSGKETEAIAMEKRAAQVRGKPTNSSAVTRETILIKKEELQEEEDASNKKSDSSQGESGLDVKNALSPMPDATKSEASTKSETKTTSFISLKEEKAVIAMHMEPASAAETLKKKDEEATTKSDESVTSKNEKEILSTSAKPIASTTSAKAITETRAVASTTAAKASSKNIAIASTSSTKALTETRAVASTTAAKATTENKAITSAASAKAITETRAVASTTAAKATTENKAIAST